MSYPTLRATGRPARSPWRARYTRPNAPRPSSSVSRNPRNSPPGSGSGGAAPRESAADPGSYHPASAADAWTGVSGPKFPDSSDWPITTTFTPKETLLNNTYYWRVRAINAHGEAGDWNEGPSFEKTFANYPLLDEDGIKNLHMRDTNDIGTDIDLGTPGYQTQLPIVAWDPVPGASSYEVNVGHYDAGIDHCDFGDPTGSRWLSSTSSTYWTPLGKGPAPKPFSSPS